MALMISASEVVAAYVVARQNLPSGPRCTAISHCVRSDSEGG